MRIPMVLIVAAMLVGAVKIHAEQTPVFGGLQIAPRVEPKASQNRGRSNPYSRLFQIAGQSKNSRSAPAPGPAPGPPVVKCGMTLIPGDSRIDPGIVAPKAKGSVRFHIRGIEPKTCW